MPQFIVFFILFAISFTCFGLPSSFVYLNEVDPSIIQEIRYAGHHNFVGRPIKGYEQATCVLTRETALALKKIQYQLLKKNLSLKVYDCYRPVSAVNDFWQWSTQSKDTTMKAEFYPRINKDHLFKLGYIAKHSGHSRGSTVDLTVVNLNNLQQDDYRSPLELKECYAPFAQRFRDNSLDMGSGFDCLDRVALVNNQSITQQAKKNRLFLQQIMIKNGFVPYHKEWWHFTLKKEPFPHTSFNFAVR